MAYIGLIIIVVLISITLLWPLLFVVAVVVFAGSRGPIRGGSQKHHQKYHQKHVKGKHQQTVLRAYDPALDKPVRGLNVRELTDCVRLHQQLAVLCPEHTIRTFEMNNLSKMLPESDYWVVRANWDTTREHTIIAATDVDLQAAYTALHKDKHTRVMMSEYNPADSPLVYRADVLWLTVINKRVDDGRIYPHKTAGLYSPRVFPEVPKEGGVRETVSDPETIAKMTNCFKKVFERLLPLVSIPGDNPAAYEDLVVDMTIGASGNMRIVNINRRTGDPPSARPVEIAAVALIDKVVSPKTYLFVGDKLEDATVAAYLPGWRRNTQMRSTEYVSLIIGAGSEMADPWLNHVPAHMKHRLQIKNITDKVNLHDNLMKLAPHTITETMHVNDDSTLDGSTPWIVRAGSGFKGSAVRVVLTTNELQEARREFIAKNPKKNQTKERLEHDIIMSRYIQNPLLLNGRKFDIRVMLIAVVHSAEAVSKSLATGRVLPEKAVYLFNKYIIVTAPKPYQNGAYLDNAIHISHDLSPTDKVWFAFDEHFPGDKSDARAKIQQLMTDAIEPLLDRVSKFEETASGYEILGADVMFDDTMTPRIAEINAIPSLRLLKIVKDGPTDYRPAYLDFLFHSIGGEFGIEVESPHAVEIVRRPAGKSGGYQHGRNNHHTRNNNGRNNRHQSNAHTGDISALENAEFPYYKLFKQESDVDRAFKSIEEYRLKIVPADYAILNMPELTGQDKQFRGRSVLCEMQAADYYTMNWISDWFNEPHRIRCKRYDEPQTQLEYFTEHRDELVASGGTLEQIRDAVYEKVRGCNNFRPGLLRGMVRAVGAKSALDISAGWGDRLIGAIAAGIRYVGVDPNPGVHEGYQEIIKKFATDSSKYALIESPFETAELPDETFDLVMTSPPYFKLEIYTDAPGQSTAVHSTEDDWFDGFLMTSVKKAWERLNPGGYLVMVINNTRGEPDYVVRMRDEINKLDSADYQGVLPYAQVIKNKHDANVGPNNAVLKYKSPQPMWIWQKRAEITLETLSEEHSSRIVEITHEPGMKYVANGKPWTPERVSQLIKYAAEDSASDTPKYAHYAVKYGKLTVGYIGWYPLDGDGDNDNSGIKDASIQLRVFIAEFEQGRGFGLAAIRQLLDEKARRYPSASMYMQMVAENTGSVKLATRAGFTQVPGAFTAGNSQVLRWKYVRT